MKVLHKMLLSAFLKSFLAALFFFVMLLQLVDLFAHLWSYMSGNVGIISVLKIQYFYIPKCISYSQPLAFLFALSFTLGNLYANNELIAIFGSGFKLLSFVAPVLILSFALSIMGFVFNEYVVIDTLIKKDNLEREALNYSQNYDNRNKALVDREKNIIYYFDFFADNSKVLTNLMILERDKQGDLVRRIEANNAKWDGEKWILKECRIFTFDLKKDYLSETYKYEYIDTRLNQSPAVFRRADRNVEQMKFFEARQWIASIKKSGLPFREYLTDYYKRFSFALTTFIVTLISGAVGSQFKKNILLMSLLLSLVLGVGYYVFLMVTSLMAKGGYMIPFIGAFLPTILFTIAGFYLFDRAKT